MAAIWQTLRKTVAHTRCGIKLAQKANALEKSLSMTLSGALCPPIFYFLNTTPVELHISCDAKHATRVLCGSAAASRLCELHRDFVCLIQSNQILALYRSSSGHQRCLHVLLQETIPLEVHETGRLPISKSRQS